MGVRRRLRVPPLKTASQPADIATHGPITLKEAKGFKHQAIEVGKSASKMIAIEEARAETLAKLGRFVEKAGLSQQQSVAHKRFIATNFSDPSLQSIIDGAKKDGYISAEELKVIKKSIQDMHLLVEEALRMTIAAQRAKQSVSGGLAAVMNRNGFGATTP
jgi:uncharacterized membrane protein YebE (DUF533 family)